MGGMWPSRDAGISQAQEGALTEQISCPHGRLPARLVKRLVHPHSLDRPPLATRHLDALYIDVCVTDLEQVLEVLASAITASTISATEFGYHESPQKRFTPTLHLTSVLVAREDSP